MEVFALDVNKRYSNITTTITDKNILGRSCIDVSVIWTVYSCYAHDIRSRVQIIDDTGHRKRVLLTYCNSVSDENEDCIYVLVGIILST